MCTIVLPLLGSIMRLVNRDETDNSRIVFALASVFVWIKPLYFLRSFESSGPLVAMILKICFDIVVFLVILFFVVFGFSVSFWMLSYPNTRLAFGSFNSSLELTFSNTLSPTFDSTDFAGGDQCMLFQPLRFLVLC